MKKLLLIIAALVSIYSCGSKKNKIIPLDLMSQITAEMFLANAYGEFESLAIADSLDLYEPIFNKYGYTATDMFYTIKDLTTRKSVRYSDVIQAAIDQLERDFNDLNAQVIKLDTVETRIMRRYASTVYSLDSLRVVNVADTADASIKIELEKGSYDIAFKYFVDEEDKNGSISFKYGIIDTAGDYRLIASSVLSRGKEDKQTASIPSILDQDSILLLELASYSRNRISNPNVRFDSISVKHSLDLEVAKDSFMREMINYRSIFESYAKIEEDSSALCADSSGLTVAVDSLPQ